MIQESRTLRAPRLLAKSAAIVASILLAFAKDAWWPDRQDRAEEQRIFLGDGCDFLFLARIREISKSIPLEGAATILPQCERYPT